MLSVNSESMVACNLSMKVKDPFDVRVGFCEGGEEARTQTGRPMLYS